MPDHGPKTEKLAGYLVDPVERVPAVLFAAHPEGPGELVLRVLVGGRLVELVLDLSVGDRVMLAEAVAGVGERPTAPSRPVSRDQTVRTRPAEPDDARRPD